VISYEARVLDEIVYKPGAWKGLRIGVFRQADGIEQFVGEYERNYPSLFETFFPFQSGKRELALYSPDYTVTRILALPECIDIGGEEGSAAGFCPVEYVVPTYAEIESVVNEDPPRRYRVNDPDDAQLEPTERTWEYPDPDTGQVRVGQSSSRAITPRLYYPFGFVAGCAWGDDSSWKLQYLDLARADEGILVRDDRFGYVELPRGVNLKASIEMAGFGYDTTEDWSEEINVAVRTRFNLVSGARIGRDE
jgi:hypothetical protein